MGRMFGTDGVRGIANAGLSGELAFKLGQASAEVLTGEVHRAKILIGMDTRISADMLEFAMVAGICSAGADACTLGVIPTSARRAPYALLRGGRRRCYQRFAQFF